jgi:endonuclease YncB( thermonuclease family)
MVEHGLLVHLEFDRERSLPDGEWLAYVYLPSGRMLNAELIRAGLARPRAETQNIRYLDLFQEITTRHDRETGPLDMTPSAPPNSTQPR